MLTAAPTPRPRCAHCLRAQSACICEWTTPIVHEVEVLVLQHPLEVNQSKGSARLLCLSLCHSRLVTGEVFETPDLQAWLSAPGRTPGGELQAKTAVLLYPPTPQDGVLPTPPSLTSTQLAAPSQLRLVVLDGTWRKSQKMLHFNPLLQSLPRLSLRDTPAAYAPLRKARHPNQLSTLEATCSALMQLENNVAQFAPLLTAFDGFVAQQLGYKKQTLSLTARAPRRGEPGGHA